MLTLRKFRFEEDKAKGLKGGAATVEHGRRGRTSG